MKKRNNLFSLIIITVFLASIFIPLAGAVLQQDEGLSMTEKRKLAQLPSLPKQLGDIKEYISGFEKYYNDQFGFRTIFIQSYAAVKKLIGDHEIAGSSANVGTKNAIKGKNGWFFLNRIWDGDPVSDYRNITIYSEPQLWRATLLFAARADWLKRRGIEYLFFFAPNKHTIYSEYLPDYIKKTGEISALDQLNDYLGRYTSVNFVDLRDALVQGKRAAAQYWQGDKEDAALYFKKDSHWNGAGADIAQYEIAEKIAQLFPGRIIPFKRPPADFIMFRFTGDITLIMGGKEKEAYGPVLTSGRCFPSTLEDLVQRNHETACDKAQLTALIFNDSFFPPLKPYFSDYFNRVVYRWERMTMKEVEKQIRIRKPDIVIEERAERHLPFTPAIGKGEDYGAFWHANWDSWKKSIYRLDLDVLTEGTYRSENVRLRYRKGKNELQVEALSNDPVLYLPDIKVEKERLYLAQVKIVSNQRATLQIYYSAHDGKYLYPSEPLSVTVSVNKGANTVYLPLLSMDMAGKIRLDPGDRQGMYSLQSFEVKEITPGVLQ